MDAEPPDAADKAQAGRHRVIAACLTCRRRKVGCDHKYPICSACARGGHVCQYLNPPAAAAAAAAAQPPAGPVSSGRVRKDSSRPRDGSRPRDNSRHLESRLDKLESLLRRAVEANRSTPGPSAASTGSNRSRDSSTVRTPSSPAADTASYDFHVTSERRGRSLLEEDDPTHLASSLHWALLADEIQGLKTLIREAENAPQQETKRSLLHRKGDLDCSSYVPESLDHVQILLQKFFTNFNPTCMLIHEPTMKAKFVREHAEKMTPLAFAVYYAAVNGLSPSTVVTTFGRTKDELLDQFEEGLEIALHREDYLRTTKFEVLQAFVIWLKCNCREDDVINVWTLLGLAIRIAISQGLHRDPSSFPRGSMSALDAELRRRLWHHIVYIDFFSAEARGFDPTISDDDFTTLLPRNVNDEDLKEGELVRFDTPPTIGYTDMTFQLVQLSGTAYLRKISRTISQTFQLIRQQGGNTRHTVATQLRELNETVKAIIEEMVERQDDEYVQYCYGLKPMQRLAIGLSAIMEYRGWSIFWSKVPRAYREFVFTPEFRQTMFDQSLDNVENLNRALSIPDAERFHWFTNTHSGFQALMHVLSELRNPSFQPSDRTRALEALKNTQALNVSAKSKNWIVARNIIELTLAENAQAGEARAPKPPLVRVPAEQVVNVTKPPEELKQYPQQNFWAPPPPPTYTQSLQTPPGVPLQPTLVYQPAFGYAYGSGYAGFGLNVSSNMDFSGIPVDWNADTYNPYELDNFTIP